jgi:hypothetical protein
MAAHITHLSEVTASLQADPSPRFHKHNDRNNE